MDNFSATMPQGREHVLPQGRRKIRAVILSTLFYIKQLVISGFLLKPFFGNLNGRTAVDYRTYKLPQIPFMLMFRLKVMWFRRMIAADDDVAHKQRLEKKFLCLIGKIEDYVEIHGTVQDHEIPIPEYDWQNGNPDDFHKKFVVNPMPVVLRGFGNGTAAVKNWNFESIIEKCGEVEVYLTGPTEDWLGPLKEVRDPTMYCANADAPFRAFPELAEDLGIPKLKPYLRRDNTVNQLFIGQKETGSGYHCAGIWNFFYMIDGEKKWTFVDPELTWMLYPVMQVGAVAFASLVSFPALADLSVYRLYKYCPRYSVHLKPGDVLFNPPWWWHAVENPTATSVAVATRWDAMRRDTSFYDLNRMLSLMATVNRKFPIFLYEYIVEFLGEHRSLLRAGGGAFDENVRVEVKNQKSRGANQYQGRVVEKIAAQDKW